MLAFVALLLVGIWIVGGPKCKNLFSPAEDIESTEGFSLPTQFCADR
jgi:hypothetical protein